MKKDKPKVKTAVTTEAEMRRKAAQARIENDMKLNTFFLPGKPKTNLFEIRKDVVQVVSYFNIIEKNKHKALFNEDGTTKTIKKVWDHGVILKDGTEIRHIEPKFCSYFKKQGVELTEKRERVPERKSI